MTRITTFAIFCSVCCMTATFATGVAHAQGGASDSPVSAVTESSPVTVSPIVEVRDASPLLPAAAMGDRALRSEYDALKNEMSRTLREHTRFRNELEAAIDALKRENADLKHTAINRENELNVLIQKLTAAQLAAQDKISADESAAAAGAALAEARLKAGTLASQLEKLTIEKERIARESAQFEQDLGSTKDRLAIAEKELSSLRIDLAATRQDSGAFSEQIKALNEQVGTLTAENQRLSAHASEEIFKSVKATDAVAQSLAVSQEETTAARAEARTLREEAAGLSAQNETVTHERDEAAAARDALQAKLTASESALADTGKARDELTARVAELEKQGAEAGDATKAVADDFRRQLAVAGEELAASVRSLHLRQEEINTLQGKLAGADARVANLSERLTTVEAELTVSEKRAAYNEKAAGQLVVAQRNLKQMQAQSADVAEENVRLKTRLALQTQFLAQIQFASAAVPAAAPALPAPSPTPPAPSAPLPTSAPSRPGARQSGAVSVSGGTSPAITTGSTGAVSVVGVVGARTPQSATTSQSTAGAATATVSTATAVAGAAVVADPTAAAGAAQLRATQFGQYAAELGRTHTVASGETLSSIAKKYYGASSAWSEIYDANRDQLKSSNSLKLGMVLRIP